MNTIKSRLSRALLHLGSRVPNMLRHEIVRAETRPWRRPAHPGAVLHRFELLDVFANLGLDKIDLAEAAGLPREDFFLIVHEAQPVTPEMASKLGAAFGGSPKSWLDLQAAFDRWEEQHADALEATETIARSGTDYEALVRPLALMIYGHCIDYGDRPPEFQHWGQSDFKDTADMLARLGLMAHWDSNQQIHAFRPGWTTEKPLDLVRHPGEPTVFDLILGLCFYVDWDAHVDTIGKRFRDGRPRNLDLSRPPPTFEMCEEATIERDEFQQIAFLSGCAVLEDLGLGAWREGEGFEVVEHYLSLYEIYRKSAFYIGKRLGGYGTLYPVGRDLKRAPTLVETPRTIVRSGTDYETLVRPLALMIYGRCVQHEDRPPAFEHLRENDFHEPVDMLVRLGLMTANDPFGNSHSFVDGWTPEKPLNLHRHPGEPTVFDLILGLCFYIDWDGRSGSAPFDETGVLRNFDPKEAPPLFDASAVSPFATPERIAYQRFAFRAGCAVLEDLGLKHGEHFTRPFFLSDEDRLMDVYRLTRANLAKRLGNPEKLYPNAPAR